MDKIKVDTVQLFGTETSVREQLDTLKAALKKMESDVTSLNAMWSGSANEAFNNTFQKDIQALGAICDAIRGIADYEHMAHNEYVKCENNVSDIIDGINISG